MLNSTMSRTPALAPADAAPTSFRGSAARIWRITAGRHGWPAAGMTTLAVLAVVLAWTALAVVWVLVVAGWLALWMLAIVGWLVLALVYLVLPWRVIRLSGMRPPRLRLRRRAA